MLFRSQQQMQDPIIQMQMKDQQIKEGELERKKQKDLMDAAAKADQQDIERERIAAQERTANKQIAVKAATDADNIDLKREMDGVKFSVDLAKTIHATRKKGNK